MLLALGLFLFAVPHFYSSLLPQSRNALREKMGEGAFKGTYAVVTLLGLVLVAYAYWVNRDSGEMLFTPTGTMRHASALLATLAMIVIAASHGKGYIKSWVRHPMSLGIALWSVGHLLSVGKFSVAWMWTILLTIALLDIGLSTLRGNMKRFEPRIRSDIIAIVVGLVLTAILALWFHPHVLGVSVG